MRSLLKIALGIAALVVAFGAGWLVTITGTGQAIPSCAKTRPFRNRPQISSLGALGIRAESRVFRAAGLTSDPWAGG